MWTNREKNSASRTKHRNSRAKKTSKMPRIVSSAGDLIPDQQLLNSQTTVAADRQRWWRVQMRRRKIAQKDDATRDTHKDDVTALVGRSDAIIKTQAFYFHKAIPIWAEPHRTAIISLMNLDLITVHVMSAVDPVAVVIVVNRFFLRKSLLRQPLRDVAVALNRLFIYLLKSATKWTNFLLIFFFFWQTAESSGRKIRIELHKLRATERDERMREWDCASSMRTSSDGVADFKRNVYVSRNHWWENEIISRFLLGQSWEGTR